MLSETALDDVYSELCRVMTALGEAATPLFLGRFALLAALKIGDEAAVRELIRAAAADMPRH
jgi:hypothetical protein